MPTGDVAGLQAFLAHCETSDGRPLELAGWQARLFENFYSDGPGLA